MRLSYSCIALCTLWCAFTVNGFAQKTATAIIDPSRPGHLINPRVYGSNGQDDQPQARVGSRRLGGNRLTTYNWENNASNAGKDWYHQSDNYLTWINGIAPAEEDIPAIFVTTFLDSSASQGVPTVLTLPMAGYVARDKIGEVPETQIAPSSRWARVSMLTLGDFPTYPDTTDDVVYVDAFLHAVQRHADTCGRPMPPIGFALDNEPELWYSTHPRVHPIKVTCDELFRKSVQFAGLVKRMLPTAEVYGPSHYGFNAMLSLQDAVDWISYRDTYPRFVDAYLDRMRQASDSAGKRLLDVLDVHWYPDVKGVFAGDVTDDVVRHRVQLPRTLWDSSYVEDSWIGQWFSPVALLPSLKSSIDRYNPGTKLGFGEYAYGAPDHVSGGIAVADVLGIFGAYDVYSAHHWGSVSGYIASAFRLWRNYDGRGSEAADRTIPAVTPEPEDLAVHATRNDADKTLHVILINRNLDSSLTVDLRIEGQQLHTMQSWYYFDQGGTALRSTPPIEPDTDPHRFHMTLPPLSAHHVVFPAAIVGVDHAPVAGRPELAIHPNPAHAQASCTFMLVSGSMGELLVQDLLGRTVTRIEGLRGGGVQQLTTRDLPAGSYMVTLVSGTARVGRVLHVIK